MRSPFLALSTSFQLPRYSYYYTKMAEGLEKITEVPVEFFKDGSAFVRKCQKPTKKGTFFQLIHHELY